MSTRAGTCDRIVVWLPARQETGPPGNAMCTSTRSPAAIDPEGPCPHGPELAMIISVWRMSPRIYSPAPSGSVSYLLGSNALVLASQRKRLATSE